MEVYLETVLGRALKLITSDAALSAIINCTQLSQNVNVVVGILRHLNMDLHASPCFFIRMPQNQMKLAALLILRHKSPTASPPHTPSPPPFGLLRFHQPHTSSSSPT